MGWKDCMEADSICAMVCFTKRSDKRPVQYGGIEDTVEKQATITYQACSLGVGEGARMKRREAV